MTEIYKESMNAGDYFFQKYCGDEKYDEWTACKHIATVAKMVNIIHNTFNISIIDSVDTVMEMVNKKGFSNLRNLGWSDYCKGFLVGIFFGGASEFNLKLADEVEKVWSGDDCICYQDAIQYVYDKHKKDYYASLGVYETEVLKYASG